MKVFVSSVISGMEDYREAAVRAVRALSHEVIRAEDFGASPSSPQVTCLAGVRQADAVVLLMGARYGTLQSSALSPTHEEYREARERCPVLVMVQDGIDREARQQQFLSEVRDWAQGHYTKSFVNADQLRDAVTGALHNLELAQATGPINPDDMLQRAMALLPEQSRSVYSGRARLALALTGGPLQTVLRPAQLEAQALRDHLHQISLFGETAVLTTRQGTETAVEGDSIILKQQDRSIALTETGSIRHITEIPGSERGLPVIIEEDVRAVIDRFLRFTDAVLGHIDPVNRLSHVVPVLKLFGASHLAWRTRTEHERSPNSVQINTIVSDDIAPAHLSPPHITRAALRQNAAELIDDLTVKLRRSLRHQRW